MEIDAFMIDIVALRQGTKQTQVDRQYLDLHCLKYGSVQNTDTDFHILSPKRGQFLFGYKSNIEI